MKGVLPLVFVLMIMVIAILGYYNLKQQSTIELLNEEIFEQARQRHNLVLDKHILQQKLKGLEVDSNTVSSTLE